MQKHKKVSKATPSAPAVSLADEIKKPSNQLAILQRLRAFNAQSRRER
jgi:hypothetical protein